LLATPVALGRCCGTSDAMSQTLLLLLILGPPVVLSIAFIAVLRIWHFRLNSGTLDAATRAKITGRCKLFTSVIKNLGWGYVLVLILLGILGRILRHE
jgi:hypothetical protein